MHIGHPDPDEISTSSVERTNLRIRLFNRRFTRLTLGYSKKLQNLKHQVALFIAHFNFCRVHRRISRLRQWLPASQITAGRWVNCWSNKIPVTRGYMLGEPLIVSGE